MNDYYTLSHEPDCPDISEEEKRPTAVHETALSSAMHSVTNLVYPK
jgi:hypothetical protein